jgi:glycosyltransferase involved in cell wall biosynthesis
MLTMGHQRDPNMDALLRTLDHHPRALVVDRFLDTEEMDALWSAADLVLSIPYSDGISESVLEAIHAGALPILSDIPSNRSLVEDGVQASLVDTDIESVVAAIVAAAHLDHPQAAEMRRHNRDWIVRNATVEATAAELASVLRGIVRASEP